MNIFFKAYVDDCKSSAIAVNLRCTRAHVRVLPCDCSSVRPLCRHARAKGLQASMR